MQLNNKNNIKRILLTGGGGSVAPLLAVAEELIIPPAPFIKGGEFEFLWLGTKFGPERAMVEQAGIKFKAISGGKKHIMVIKQWANLRPTELYPEFKDFLFANIFMVCYD